MTGSANGVLVGYDGSPCSKEALLWAAREATSRRLPLTVCHAWALGCTVPRHELAVLALAREAGEQVLAEGVRRGCDFMGWLPRLGRCWSRDQQQPLCAPEATRPT